ncbi:hypothetical protein X769_19420 [Mesorhizobium sp. LSJC268A00]|nr:hypothetical protein X769_19420 [Mesorhizobium sp. LSJC268A00]ESY12426.1 hypothetical protein X752_05970 [Mesorhizobium sp. LNJC398B00]ESY44892.1 hypothetical protein X746_21130 [Mesorhizobium sp. LNJC380A00]ESZ40658.1 hypothetical protein X732_10095 [Mesorhizobium sp. L2C066B000]ESZ56650.1 hypothetical protein X729_24340 [Mesorhizobium sp. L103C131B0]ESZ69542.1 hypothetical protein X727_16885 [Mesorhizobium sp. L103C119B0]
MVKIGLTMPTRSIAGGVLLLLVVVTQGLR